VRGRKKIRNLDQKKKEEVVKACMTTYNIGNMKGD